jgi:LAO/AO transport system kinase
MVESLGVGQDELDIAKYVDVTALVLVPGFGDAIQMAKAGIMEIADVFMINKSDHHGAQLLRAQLLDALHTRPAQDRPAVANAIANRGEGIDAPSAQSSRHGSGCARVANGDVKRDYVTRSSPMPLRNSHRKWIGASTRWSTRCGAAR